MSPPDGTSNSGSDGVLVTGHDISDCNPDNILALPTDDIVKIRHWLQPTAYDHRFGEYQKHLASHAAGTGLWLTTSPTYREWLQGQQLSTLWVKGIPGSGKSVIAASLIHDLAAEHPGTPVLYFFFRQIIDANHDPLALLRDWVDQLLIYSPPLQQRLHEHVEACRPLDTLSMDDLWGELRLALAGLPNGAYCVVDALDEIGQGHDNFLRTLAELGLWKPKTVKLLMTSRPIARLEATLRKVEMLQIRLDETAVDKDIATFMQRKLNSTSIPDPDKKLILDAVPGQANGLFLYARLAMDALFKPGANIHHVLAALPQTLSDMYADLLRVHSLRSDVPPGLQRMVLQCATHASRPLRVLEVTEMLERTYPSRAEENVKATKEIVRAACGPLLEILLDETVCVVHHSFTEYLTDISRLDTNEDSCPLKPGPTHNTLALACLNYLEYALSGVKSQFEGLEEDIGPKALNNGVRGRKRSLVVKARLKYPSLEYAASNWHVHVTKSTLAGYHQGEVNKVLQRLFIDDAQLNAWFQLAWPWSIHGFGGFTQLHMAAGLGLDHYLMDLLQTRSIDVDSQDKLGRTPLWWAASSGHAGAVRLLAQAGANPDQDDNYDGRRPLHKASESNHAKVVKTLLEHGVSITTGKTREIPNRLCGNGPKSVGDTPLMYACHYGHLETVDIFLSCILDPDLLQRALFWAASQDRPAIIRRILQHPKADVKAEERGTKLLALACSNGGADSVSILLEAGADPNINQSPDAKPSSLRHVSESSLGHSPLHMLCRARKIRGPDDNYRQVIFSLLMAAGLNVHERDRKGANALHWAEENPVMTRLLIDAGVDANAASFNGNTPLHRTKNSEVMHLLVSLGGASINQRNKKGLTPLLACLTGLVSLTSEALQGINQLLEFRPDCSVVDNKGDNVLHHLIRLSSYENMTDLLRQLLALGVDPNCRNSSGDVPLHNISRRLEGNQQVLDLLLAAGADLNAKDMQGATVIFRAIADSWTENMEFVETLITKEASLTARDFQGRTLLHEAIKTRWTGIFIKPGVGANFFEFFLARGIDSSGIDNHGNNLLHELAVRSRDHDEDLWKRLLALGLDLSQRNYTGRSPLHMICSTRCTADSLDCIDFIISEMKHAGTNSVDIVDNAGITPLHLASTVSGSYVQKLLDAGADPTLATYEGRTPLHLAAQSRAGNIVGILLDALCRRQMERNLPVVDTCDDAVPSIPRGSWYRDKAFQFLPEMINPKDHYRPSDFGESGWTPLQYACRSGRPETVALLLQAGAAVKAKGVFEACSQFEDEQTLWDRRHERENNLGAGGLLLTDTDRPSATAKGKSKSNQDQMTDDQTPRIDDILEMILQSTMPHDVDRKSRDIWEDSLIEKAFAGRKDYTAGRLAKAFRSQNEFERANGRQTSAYSYAFHKARCFQEATRYSPIKYNGSRSGNDNLNTFESLMLRRDYDAVREIARTGVDFFEEESPYESNNFRVLSRLGFVFLAKGIVDDLYPEVKEAPTKEHTQQPSAYNSQGRMTRTKSDRFKESSYLLAAVRQESPNMEMVRFLVEDCGVDINKLRGRTKRHDASSPLLCVARGDQWWHAALAVPYFIEQAADLNVRNDRGQTPLHVALGARKKQDEGFFRGDIVRALVKAGADVNAVDAEGRSCFTYAAGDARLFQLLLGNGGRADPHTLLAIIDGNDNESLRMILSSGIDPNTRLPEVPMKNAPKHLRDTALPLYSALHYAAHLQCLWGYNILEENQAVLDTRRIMVETLLEYGADPFAPSAQRSKPSITGEDLNAADEPSPAVSESHEPPVPQGYVRSTILHDLVEESRLVEPFLTIANLDVDRRDANGKTLLLSACVSELGPDHLVGIASPPLDCQRIPRQSILKHLLSLGADPFAKDNQGRNALHTMFNGVYLNGDMEGHSITDSLPYMANTYPTLVNQKDNLGNTPLHLACHFATGITGSTEPAMLLLEAGADPLLLDPEGNSGLHILAARLDRDGVYPLFRTLLGRGCDVNGRNKRGETPIFAYYAFDHLDPKYAEESLIEDVKEMWDAAGADFGVCDYKGRGLLHVAADRNLGGFVELLRVKGLDPKAEDGDRRTAVDVAAACANEGVLELFRGERGQGGE
ncbi:ankyrin repeat-containing domain protein [Astrocystis sublimbata]|nr:ankyrin repeat-containing domain protein [Astrocystis sublimbata]